MQDGKKMTELEQRIIDFLQNGGMLEATKAAELLGISVCKASGMMRHLHTQGHIKRSSEGQRYTYYIREDTVGDMMTDLACQACGMKPCREKRIVVTRDDRIDDLRSMIYDMDQDMVLDSVEEGYVYGAKQAAIRADWQDAQCHLANLEVHLKNKLDKVHKITVEVKREARRKK